MTDTINPGDTVKLNSGGPVMTVRSVDGDDRHCYCAWFDGASYKTGDFPQTSLTRAKASVNVMVI